MSVINKTCRNDKSIQANFNDFLLDRKLKTVSRNFEVINNKKGQNLFYSLDNIRRVKDLKNPSPIPLKNKVVLHHILRSTHHCENNIENSKWFSDKILFFKAEEKALLSEKYKKRIVATKTINGTNLNFCSDLNKTFDSNYFSNPLRGTYYKGKIGRAKSVLNVTSKSYVKELLFKKLVKRKTKTRSVFPSIKQ